MVTLYTEHNYSYDFATATTAYYNKYPNPYSKGVVSIDTISMRFTPERHLHIDRLVHKQGSLPWFARALIGRVTDTWILETSIVDPVNKTLKSWTRNINHKKILRVDDYAVYSQNKGGTSVNHRVVFTSRLQFGIREKIENWSKQAFLDRIKQSRQGMSLVMEQVLAKFQNPSMHMQ